MLNSLSPNLKEQIKRGISLLKGGGVVAFPTDTVYGLGACVSLSQAVERVYQVKARPRHMPLPLLLAHTAQIFEVAEWVPPIAWLFIRNFLPGALTLVLRKSRSVPDIVTAGGTTVAIRIPAHPIPMALIEGLGTPIIGTSANLSGHPTPLTAEEVDSQIGDKIDLIIDGGKCPGGKESTIIDVSGERPLLIREGAIAKEEIERVYGNILVMEVK